MKRQMFIGRTTLYDAFVCKRRIIIVIIVHLF
jgi:hypothetical protein